MHFFRARKNATCKNPDKYSVVFPRSIARWRWTSRLAISNVSIFDRRCRRVANRMCRVATQNHFFAATNKMCCIAARKTAHWSVIVIYRSGKRQSDGSVGQPRRSKYRELDCTDYLRGSGQAALDRQSHQFGRGTYAKLLAHNGRRVGDRFVGGMNQPRDLGKAFAGAEQT